MSANFAPQPSRDLDPVRVSDVKTALINFLFEGPDHRDCLDLNPSGALEFYGRLHRVLTSLLATDGSSGFATDLQRQRAEELRSTLERTMEEARTSASMFSRPRETAEARSGENEPTSRPLKTWEHILHLQCVVRPERDAAMYRLLSSLLANDPVEFKTLEFPLSHPDDVRALAQRAAKQTSEEIIKEQHDEANVLEATDQLLEPLYDADYFGTLSGQWSDSQIGALIAVSGALRIIQSQLSEIDELSDELELANEGSYDDDDAEGDTSRTHDDGQMNPSDEIAGEMERRTKALVTTYIPSLQRCLQTLADSFK